MIKLTHISKFLQHIRLNPHTNSAASRITDLLNPSTVQLFKSNLHKASTMSANSYNCYKYLYLHGFASGKESGKGLLLKNFFEEQGGNVELQLPDLNIPSFEQLSVTQIVKHLKNEILGSTHRYRLIGSSLGGLIAATLAAELEKSSKIHSLILLCPALDASNRWKAKMTDDELHQWQLQGSKKFYHFGTKSEQHLHYGFYEDLVKYEPYPLVHVLLTIVHGINDDVVPVNNSRTYIELLQRSGYDNELIEVNDDHLLVKADSIEVIKSVIKKRWFNED